MYFVHFFFLIKTYMPSRVFISDLFVLMALAFENGKTAPAGLVVVQEW